MELGSVIRHVLKKYEARGNVHWNRWAKDWLNGDRDEVRAERNERAASDFLFHKGWRPIDRAAMLACRAAASRHHLRRDYYARQAFGWANRPESPVCTRTGEPT